MMQEKINNSVLINFFCFEKGYKPSNLKVTFDKSNSVKGRGRRIKKTWFCFGTL